MSTSEAASVTVEPAPVTVRVALVAESSALAIVMSLKLTSAPLSTVTSATLSVSVTVPPLAIKTLPNTPVALSLNVTVAVSPLAPHSIVPPPTVDAAEEPLPVTVSVPSPPLMAMLKADVVDTAPPALTFTSASPVSLNSPPDTLSSEPTPVTL